MTSIRRRSLWLSPLALGALLLLSIVAFQSVRIMEHPFAGFLFWDNGSLVSFHLESWTGPRQGLPLNGGRLLEVNGEPFQGGGWLRDRVAALPEGSLVHYQIEDDGKRQDYRVPTMSLHWRGYVATFGIYLLNGFAFLLVAVVAISLRPESPGARGLAISTACMGLLLTLAIDYFSSYRFVPVYLALEGFTPAALWFFVVIFPVERCSPRVAATLLGVLGAVGLALGLANFAVYYTHPELSRSITLAIYVLVSLAGLALVISFAETLLHARSVQKRVQAAFVFAGGLVGLVLPAVGVLAFFLLGWTISTSWIALLLPVLPISILYAVLRHDVLGVERFARLAMGYALATAAVMLVYTLVISALGRVVGRGVAFDPLVTALVIAGIAAGFSPLRRRVQELVDRVFYRTSVDAAAVLETTAARLAVLPEERGIQQVVEDACLASLNVAWARFVPAREDLPGAALQEPVVYQGQLRGVLGCGDKLSAAPFSERERELLKGLATQMALALETARSVRKLREAQQALIRSERLAAIGEFSGAVAHGIRNPLSGIRAMAEAALGEPEGPQRDELLRATVGETDRLDQRIRALLDYSRPVPPSIQDVDVADVLHQVSKTIGRRAERDGISVVVKTPGSAVRVPTDPDQLEDALLELLGNALRVTERGGRILLQLEAAAEDGGAVIRVGDTGPGIPEAVRDQIFGLFFTTRPDGTGLGLATVSKVMSRLGGQVALESSSHDGSVFRIDLPAHLGQEAQPETESWDATT